MSGPVLMRVHNPRQLSEGELLARVERLESAPDREKAMQCLSILLARQARRNLLMLAEPSTDEESITCFCIDCISQLPPLNRLNKRDQGGQGDN